MKFKYGWLSLSIIMLVSSLFAPVAHAQTNPTPHAFHGTVNFNESPAPVGTVVSAKVRGTYSGKTIVVQQGLYGLPDPEYNSLVIQGAQSGDRIIFYVNGFRAAQTYLFQAGESTELNLSAVKGATDISDIIDEDGVLIEPVTIQSEDGTATIDLPAGIRPTVINPETGLEEPITVISFVSTSPPAPPSGNSVAFAYNLSANGFNTGVFFRDPVTGLPVPIAITIRYNPALLPAGMVEANLFISWYNPATGLWESLVSVVDIIAKTVTAFIDHFSVFALLFPTVAPGPGPSPGGPSPVVGGPFFEFSDLDISPKVILPGETVGISAKAANTGDKSGSYTVRLKINGDIEATKEITLDADESTTVKFSVSRDTPATYRVELEGLSGSFTVSAIPIFLSELNISPTEVSPGQPVTVSVKATNIGTADASYNITLKINGLAEATKTVSVPGNGNITVTFTVIREQPGTYTVEVDSLLGSFTVKEVEVQPTFAVSNLTISPGEVLPGQPVTISARVTNTGTIQGSHTVTLKINGQIEATKEVTLAGGASTTVTFSVTRDEPATYNIEVDGQPGTFIVKAEVAPPTPKPFPWWWIVVGVVVVGLAAVYFLIIRKRRVSVP